MTFRRISRRIENATAFWCSVSDLDANWHLRSSRKAITPEMLKRHPPKHPNTFVPLSVGRHQEPGVHIVEHPRLPPGPNDIVPAKGRIHPTAPDCRCRRQAKFLVGSSCGSIPLSQTRFSLGFQWNGPRRNRFQSATHQPIDQPLIQIQARTETSTHLFSTCGPRGIKTSDWRHPLRRAHQSLETPSLSGYFLRLSEDQPIRKNGHGGSGLAERIRPPRLPNKIWPDDHRGMGELHPRYFATA